MDSKRHRAVTLPPLVLVLLGGVLALLLWLLPARAQCGTLLVDVLDVGQGDAILIRAEPDKAVLIDAGDGDENVVDRLRGLGVQKLDLAVATHAHADHIGGMEHVVRSLPIGHYMDSGVPHTSQTYGRLMAAIEELGIDYLEARAGRTIQLGTEATLEILWPAKVPLRNTRSDLNANSVVLRLLHEGHCMLFMGDAEQPTEVRVVNQGAGPCDVLKVAHHGSNHSTTGRFLDAVQPRIAIISAGEDNRYGHPGSETLRRLQQRHVLVYRTDESGTLRVVSRKGNLEVLEGMEPPPPPAEGDTASSQ